jgi:hypothetical protein
MAIKAKSLYKFNEFDRRFPTVTNRHTQTGEACNFAFERLLLVVCADKSGLGPVCDGQLMNILMMMMIGVEKLMTHEVFMGFTLKMAINELKFEK